MLAHQRQHGAEHGLEMLGQPAFVVQLLGARPAAVGKQPVGVLVADACHHRHGMANELQLSQAQRPNHQRGRQAALLLKLEHKRLKRAAVGLVDRRRQQQVLAAVGKHGFDIAGGQPVVGDELRLDRFGDTGDQSFDHRWRQRVAHAHGVHDPRHVAEAVDDQVMARFVDLGVLVVQQRRDHRLVAGRNQFRRHKRRYVRALGNRYIMSTCTAVNDLK